MRGRVCEGDRSISVESGTITNTSIEWLHRRLVVKGRKLSVFNYAFQLDARKNGGKGRRNAAVWDDTFR